MPFVNTKMTDSGGGSAQASAYKTAGKTADQYAHDQAVAAINKYLKQQENISNAKNAANKALEITSLLVNPVGTLVGKGVKSAVSAIENMNISGAIGNIVNSVSNVGTSLVDRVNSVVNDIFPQNGSSGNSYGSYGSVGSTGSGVGVAGLGSSGSYDSIQNAINEATRANNEWAAEQAQKQMDFQREMSSTAHQREVADLQAAGLNPVLSAGGSGASTPSGAMAQPDTTNSRAILELALASLEAVSNTAAGFAGVARASSGSTQPQTLIGRIANSTYGKKFLGSAASALGSSIVRALF